VSGKDLGGIVVDAGVGEGFGEANRLIILPLFFCLLTPYSTFRRTGLFPLIRLLIPSSFQAYNLLILLNSMELDKLVLPFSWGTRWILLSFPSTLMIMTSRSTSSDTFFFSFPSALEELWLHVRT
jgi:hypothetical protein